MTRRAIWPVLAAALALSATGIAVAELRPPGSATAVTATFSATKVELRRSALCGTVQVTNAVYTGRSSGDPTLTGPVRISVRAAIDTVAHLGTVDGFVAVGDTKAHLTAVYRDGKIGGLVAGATGTQRLVGTLTAGYSPEGGFAGGAIGSGSLAGLTLRTSDGNCTQPKPEKPQSGTQG